MSEARYEDQARAARLVSAVAAEDALGYVAVMRAAKADGRLAQLALALAVRHIQVCAEHYGVADLTGALDAFAFDANALANRERCGDE